MNYYYSFWQQSKDNYLTPSQVYYCYEEEEQDEERFEEERY